MGKEIDIDLLDYDYEEMAYTLDGIPYSGITKEVDKNGGLDEAMLIWGKKNGLLKLWWPNGIQKSEQSFQFDSLHGVSYEWNESGNLIFESIYEFGILVRKWEYKPNGELISSYRIGEKDSLYESLIIHRKFRRSNFGKPRNETN